MRNITCVSVFLLLASSCTGTETDNPLADFKTTGCKDHNETALTLPPDSAPFKPRYSSDYDGLYCYDYDYDNEQRRLIVHVFNYPSGCGSTFTGATAETFNGRVRLSLERSSCEVARCGTCHYDLSFAINDVELTGPYRVELAQVGCEGTNAERETEVVLINSGMEQETGTHAYCITLDEPAACERDNDCQADLERCGDAGACEPLMTFDSPWM